MKRFFLFFLFFFFSFSAFSQTPKNKWAVARPSITTDFYVLDSKPIPLSSSTSVARPVTPISYSIPASGTQSFSQSLVIEAIDKSSTLTGRFKWASYQTRQALQKFVSLGRLTPQSAVGSAILGYAINKGFDWVLGEDGNFYEKSQDLPKFLDGQSNEPPIYPSWNWAGVYYNSPITACQVYESSYPHRTVTGFSTRFSNSDQTTYLNCLYKTEFSSNNLDYTLVRFIPGSNTCPSGYSLTEGGCYADDQSSTGNPVPQDQIDSIFDEMTFDDMDVPAFTELVNSGSLPSPDEFIIDTISPNPVSSNPEISVTDDFESGDQLKTETVTDYKFEYHNSNGNPVVSGSSSRTTTRYRNDEIVSRETTTSQGDPVDGTQPDSSSSFDWMCGIDGRPDCNVSVDDSGFENEDPLNDFQERSDTFFDDISSQLDEPCISIDCFVDSDLGFSVDSFLPDLSPFTGTCVNPSSISIFGAPVVVDICWAASFIRPILTFLLYFFILYRFRQLFMTAVRGE